MHSEFRTKLVSLSDDAYRDFSMRGIPCKCPFLGVWILKIRELVGKIPEEDFDGFLVSF